MNDFDRVSLKRPKFASRYRMGGRACFARLTILDPGITVPTLSGTPATTSLQELSLLISARTQSFEYGPKQAERVATQVLTDRCDRLRCLSVE